MNCYVTHKTSTRKKEKHFTILTILDLGGVGPRCEDDVVW